MAQIAQRTPRSRRPRVGWWLALVLVLLAGAMVYGVRGLRWRAELIGFKAAGKIPGITWGEMLANLRPNALISLEPIVASRNPFQSISNPRVTAADVTAGREAFAIRCASCHGPDGRGGSAPSLLGGQTGRGDSDWAMYQAISRGVPGTGMPATDVTKQTAWQLVAYVQSLRAGIGAGEALTPDRRAKVRPVSAEAIAAARTTPADWLTYSGSYDGWRYSPLDQINRTNVHRLRLLWMYQMRDGDQRLETSPLALDGVLYITTPQNGVIGIDAESGTALWSRERELASRMSLCCGRVNRGLAILDTTLFLATLDARLVALDARSGAVRWDVAVADPSKGYSFTSAPLAVRDLVVIGSAGGEFASRGFITAYDAATGKERWRFETIPAPGRPGNETWSGRSWETGGGPAWLSGSYDPALGLLYWGIGNPNPDYNGDDRLGDNLYTNSVVALEAATGERRWHFQFTPHDEHDWDSVQIPILVDASAGGRPLLLWANRNGFYYVLDRSTGQFLRGRPFVPQTWADGLDSAGRPRVRAGSAPTREGVLSHPGQMGATNWWSPSYHPGTGSLYVPSFGRGDIFFKGRSDGAVAVRMGGSIVAQGNAGRFSIRALDALTGVERWEHVLVDPMAISQQHFGGVLSTAGGIVFGGGDDLLVALDADDGRRLWSFRAGQGVHAAPITYLVGNRQRFTIAVGRALLTFGLD